MAKQPKGGGITWTEETWNCLRGCSRVSEGCRHCYAERVAARFSGPGQPYEGLARMVQLKPRNSMDGKSEAHWTGEVRFIEDKLLEPMRWKRPRRVFVNSMSDVFHEKVSDEDIDRIFAVMLLSPQHSFQLLTKRAERMRDWALAKKHLPNSKSTFEVLSEALYALCLKDPKLSRINGIDPLQVAYDLRMGESAKWWPLKNAWLGVSCEDQKTADERIPMLLQTPAKVRWVSYEPALGPVDFRHLCPQYMTGAFFNSLTGSQNLMSNPGDPRLDWIVVGGESGTGARPFDVQWARDTITQCKAAGTACFVKQFGAHVITDGIQGGVIPLWPEGSAKLEDTGLGHWRKRLSDKSGGDMSEWPDDLKVREYPQC